MIVKSNQNNYAIQGQLYAKLLKVICIIVIPNMIRKCAYLYNNVEIYKKRKRPNLPHEVYSSYIIRPGWKMLS